MTLGTPVEPTSPSSHPPSCILVVDDQPANIQVVGSVLGKLGHEIIPASDGATALRRIGLRRPDLILLDLLMPGMDGCEVCQALKASPEHRDIPVIFLSAADDKDFIVRALEAGGVDYVTKPFHHAELVTRVRTQLALKLAQDRLRELAEDKDELLGILAHDLKNHLGGMQMSAQLLREQVQRAGQAEGRTARLAGNIAQTSAHLLTFVKEFLANSAAERGLTLRPSALDVAASVRSTLETYRDAARLKSLEMRCTLPTEPVRAWADPSGLDQVLENLVSNAVKFSPPGAGIEVVVSATADHVECRVRDAGPGFSADDRARLFQRYRRLSARPTAGEPSTGLGLSIVRKLVQAMNGQVTCESEPGQGALFIVRLPRAIAAH
ncbi:MAG: hybrid sensor histidine kinase/response regulator [Verrucomicrobiales bacterium]|nr:hybrid sensor histidine kinase/response regulator [Verrucomicrobiales bacterium]